MISLARLRLALGIEPADEAHEDDDLIEFLLAHAIADVELRTGHYFGVVADRTEVIKGLGTRNLWLNSIPLTDAEGEVTVFEQAYPGATQTELVEGEDFEIRISGPEAWLARLGGNVWTKGYEYVVSMERGYAVDALPGAIESLVISLVDRAYASNGSEGMKSENIGGYSYTKATDDDIASIEGAFEAIGYYRRPVIA